MYDFLENMVIFITMIEYFTNNFIFNSQNELNSFVRLVVGITESYLGFLLKKGKLYLPLDLNVYDCAIELSSELFIEKDKKLIKFDNYFAKLENPPLTNDEFIKYLNGFIIFLVHNNLPNIYKHSDSITYKAIRNFKSSIKEKDFFVTLLFTGKYLHRKEIDWNGNYLEREDLLKLYYSDNSGQLSNTVPEFLDKIFDLIEKQKDYIHTVTMNDLIYVYKQTLLNEHYVNHSNGDAQSNIESNLHIKLLLEEMKEDFFIKQRNYFNKADFSENMRVCMYNIIEDVINDLITGIKRKSVLKLVEKYIPQESQDEYYNKIEYCLQIFDNELLKVLYREEIIYK